MKGSILAFTLGYLVYLLLTYLMDKQITTKDYILGAVTMLVVTTVLHYQKTKNK